MVAEGVTTCTIRKRLALSASLSPKLAWRFIGGGIFVNAVVISVLAGVDMDEAKAVTGDANILKAEMLRDDAAGSIIPIQYVPPQ